MKVEIIKPVPVSAKVVIETTEAVAHIIRLSMGFTATGALEDGPAGDDHYTLFVELGKVLGPNPYTVSKVGSDNRNIVIVKRHG